RFGEEAICSAPGAGGKPPRRPKTRVAKRCAAVRPISPVRSGHTGDGANGALPDGISSEGGSDGGGRLRRLISTEKDCVRFRIGSRVPQGEGVAIVEDLLTGPLHRTPRPAMPPNMDDRRGLSPCLEGACCACRVGLAVMSRPVTAGFSAG